jgi:hypothetical protein
MLCCKTLWLWSLVSPRWRNVAARRVRGGAASAQVRPGCPAWPGQFCAATVRQLAPVC